MMIYDVHTYIGHFPFRKTNHKTITELKDYLNRSNIQKALVSNMEAIFYRDVMSGNFELFEIINNSDSDIKNMFDMACVINPKYPAWKEDFIKCIDELGFKAVVMLPFYHDYYLDDPQSISLINLAGDMGVPVVLPRGLEDMRQRHHLDVTRNLETQEVLNALKKNDNANIVIVNAHSPTMAKALHEIDKTRSGNVYYDFCRVDALKDEFIDMLNLVGSEKLLFGSLAPLLYVEPQLVKLEYLDIDDVSKEMIKSKNALSLFNKVKKVGG